MVGKVHLQRHHRLRQRRYSLIGGDERSDGEEVACLFDEKPAASATAAATAPRSAAR
jgi:hypothetical protein